MLKTAGFTFFSKLISAALNFGLIILISNVLGPGERGKCAFFLIIIVVMVGISEIAGGATTAYLMQRFSPQAILKLHARWTIVPVVLIPILFYVCKTISWPEMLLLGLGGWFYCRWNMQQHTILALHHYNRFNISIVLSPLLAIVFFGIFWMAGFASRFSYLLSLVLSWVFLFVVTSYFLKIEFSKFSRVSPCMPAFMDLMRPGILNQAAHIVSLVNNRLIFFMLPAIQLGLWSNALTVAESILMVPGSLGQILYSQLASRDNKVNPGKAFRMAVLYNGFFMGMGLVILALLPDSFWTQLFGKGFAGMKQYLFVMLPGLGFYSYYLIITYRQSAGGKFLLNLFPLLFGLIFNMGGSFYLVFSGNYSLMRGVWLLCLSLILISISSIIFYLFKAKRKSLSSEQMELL